MSNLFLIPARAGSKGVVRKNVRLIADRPLFSFSLDFALSVCNHDDVVCVTSDDEQILRLAEARQHVEPLRRPKELADDKSKSIDVALHALEYFSQRGFRFENIILLQPTCPFRRITTFVNALKIMSSSDSYSLISVKKEEYIHPSVSYHAEAGRLKPISRQHNSGGKRQNEKAYLVRTGNVYITSVEYLEDNHSFICDNPSFVLNDIFESINIDTEEDLELAKIVGVNWVENEYWYT